LRIKPSPLSYLTLSAKLAQAAVSSWQAAFLPSRPVQIENFGSNPGNLRMYVYAPPRLRAGRPLVVLLHGCGQSAGNFATDAGWIALAQHYRFALLLPEQLRTNNHLGCFNWFQPGDVRRNSGETLSIRQMIRKAVKNYGSDPRQIFVAGFSAGGGMTAALLAAYPALFAAAGIFAGMPVGSAHNGVGALIKMRRAGSDHERERLAREVTRDSKPRRKWPRVSIWQGEKDRTVDPQNAEVLAAQWSELQGYGPVATATHTTPACHYQSWGKPGKPPAVELWTLPAMGHAVPVDSKKDIGSHTGAVVVDAGVSGPHMLAAFWGLKKPNA
jgi:poly(hydroxyalkanoate) depolymerase family esterase